MVRLELTRLLASTLISISVVLAGCSGKAQALKVAATQYEVESLAAINAIEELGRKEIEPPPQTDAAATKSFVDNVISSTKTLNSDAVERALSSPAPKINPAALNARTDLLNETRQQYTSFARIFDDIEAGSFFAREDVSKAGPYVEKLTVQLVYLARRTNDHPGKWLVRRGVLLADLNAIKMGKEPYKDRTDEQKRQLVAEWRDKWIAVQMEEEEYTRRAVEQCLKAATIGMTIKRQIDDYAKLSVQDIGEALDQGLVLAGSFSGRDLSSLQADTKNVIATIESDPAWSAVAKKVLEATNPE